MQSGALYTRAESVIKVAIAGLVLMWLGAGAAAPSIAADAPPDPASPYQVYRLEPTTFSPAPHRKAGVLLRVRINGGRPLRLVVDSGAEYIVIGAKAGKSLGLTDSSDLDLVGLGTRRAKLARADQVDVDTISFRNCRVALVEGRVIDGADGVIPLAMFSDFLVRLNLPGKVLELIPYTVTDYAATPPAPNREHRNPLLAEAVLNGTHQGYVVLDTGAYCSAVARKLAGNGGIFLGTPEVRIGAGTGLATGQLVSSPVRFEVDGLSLSPSEVVAVDLSNISRRSGKEMIGVLGFPALSPYILTVDYRKEQVQIESARNTISHESGRRREGNSTAQLSLR